jgi:hypothetical protein
MIHSRVRTNAKITRKFPTRGETVDGAGSTAGLEIRRDPTPPTSLRQDRWVWRGKWLLQLS